MSIVVLTARLCFGLHVALVTLLQQSLRLNPTLLNNIHSASPISILKLVVQLGDAILGFCPWQHGSMDLVSRRWIYSALVHNILVYGVINFSDRQTVILRRMHI